MSPGSDQSTQQVGASLSPAKRGGARSPSALRNVLSNWGGFFSSSVIAFFISPFVVRHLGDSAYGVWVLVGSLTGYLGLLDMGVRGAVTRYVASFHSTHSHDEASRITSSALAIFLAAGLLAILISVTLAAFALSSLDLPPAYRSVAALVLIIAGCNIAVSLVSGVFAGVLTAMQRFDLQNLIEIASGILRNGAIVLALLRGNGLVALALIQLMFALANCTAYVLTSRRGYPQLRVRVAECDLPHLRMIFSFSFYAFLINISMNLIFYTDSVVIGYFLPISLITYFAIAGNLINYSRDLIRGVSGIAAPKVSALDAGGDLEGVRRVLLRGAQFSTLIILPIALTFMLRGKSFITMWMGAQYGDRSGHVLWILTLALLFLASEQVSASTMMGISKHKPLAKLYLGEALCNLAMSVALVRSLGIYGVAWGTTLPSLAVSLVFWPWYVHHTLGIPVSTYLTFTWLRPAAAAIPFGLFTYGFERLWAAPNLFVFFLQTGAILPTIVIASWFICFDDFDRETYGRKFLHPILKTLGWN